MSDLVRFSLEDGSEVYFETAEGDLVTKYSGELDVEDGGPLTSKLSQAAATADAVARTLRAKLSPDELAVELGFKISGEVNWFFAKNTAEGNIKVTLKWLSPAAISAVNHEAGQEDDSTTAPALEAGQAEVRDD